MIHTTIGLYANGSFKINGVLPEHLTDHIQYNLDMRPGRSFFVDGKCKNKGYHTDQEIKEFEERIKNDIKFKAVKCTAPYV
ncbi:hypothetical protein KO504_16920 [Winogradskyella psychrotolerans]|uniref:hypothetical protein n=1 Tax=Winogradskyella psychrotolerans TaxID=1344585 RepID=UPI001C06F697|nr:hypothetical protein [Winogradskyella psychrotolerans]MBU2923034.1 hypothetical protein [Winogradskyella psychrotolerans]